VREDEPQEYQQKVVEVMREEYADKHINRIRIEVTNHSLAHNLDVAYATMPRNLPERYRGSLVRLSLKTTFFVALDIADLFLSINFTISPGFSIGDFITSITTIVLASKDPERIRPQTETRQQYLACRKIHRSAGLWQNHLEPEPGLSVLLAWLSRSRK
jgi:hypothetical protein